MKTNFEALYVHRQIEIKNIPEHKHNTTELVYFEHGTGITAIHDTEYHYSPNTFTIIRPLTVMDERHHTLTTTWCLHIDINPSMNFLDNGIYTDTKDRQIFHLLMKIRNEQAAKLYHYEDMLNALTEQILVETERIQDIKSAEKSAFKDVINAIEENYFYDIELEQLADLTNYSYDHFRHLFKRAFGVSPKGYIMNRRISQAKHLLKQGSYSAAYVAQLCGFSSDTQFNKTFKKYTGYSPGEYKKLQHKRVLTIYN